MFEVARPVKPSVEDFGGIRSHVRSLLDGRVFEEFHLDSGVGDPIVGTIDYLVTPPLLEFAGIQPTVVPCYPISQQIAEKLHALTRFHPVGEGSWVKDLVDILLTAGLAEIDGTFLMKALEATFDVRQTHPLPDLFPDVPSGWTTAFRKMAEEVGLHYGSLEEANNAAKGFLNPILSRVVQGRWDPIQWSWRLG